MTHAFDTTPRVRLSAQKRAALFLERGGRCEACTKPIRAGERWEVEHTVALMNGGSNEPSNLRVICKNCHKPKTRDDHGQASRTRDKAVAHVVPGAYRTKSSRFRKPPGTRWDWAKGRLVRDDDGL